MFFYSELQFQLIMGLGSKDVSPSTKPLGTPEEVEPSPAKVALPPILTNLGAVAVPPLQENKSETQLSKNPHLFKIKQSETQKMHMNMFSGSYFSIPTS